MNLRENLLSSKSEEAQQSTPEPVSTIINEVQLILAEKRTSLIIVLTGIAIFAIPISVLSFLIATSKYYNVTHIILLFVPLMIINATLAILALYLIIRSISNIRHHDQHIKELKLRYSLIADIID